MIIQVEFDDLFISMAEAKADEMGVLKNSIRHGEGSIIGFLGEFLVADVFNGHITNTYDFDIIVNGKVIDIKTKSTTVEPQSNFLCSVAAFNTAQKCDSYYFTRINFEKRIGYLLGGLSKKSFYERATFGKEGEPDGEHFKFRCDCWNIPISALKQPQLNYSKTMLT